MKLIAISALNMEDVLCITCGKNFKTKVQLTKHISTVHKISKISCEECGKSMKNKKHLENHKSSHKTVTCKNCKKVIPKNSRTSHSCYRVNSWITIHVINVKTKKLKETSRDYSFIFTIHVINVNTITNTSSAKYTNRVNS